MSLKDKRISLGATPRFKQLEPGEECEFVKASIPEEFESEWDTGYGKNKTLNGLLPLPSLNIPILLTLFLIKV